MSGCWPSLQEALEVPGMGRGRGYCDRCVPGQPELHSELRFSITDLWFSVLRQGGGAFLLIGFLRKGLGYLELAEQDCRILPGGSGVQSQFSYEACLQSPSVCSQSKAAALSPCWECSPACHVAVPWSLWWSPSPVSLFHLHLGTVLRGPCPFVSGTSCEVRATLVMSLDARQKEHTLSGGCLAWGARI